MVEICDFSRLFFSCRKLQNVRILGKMNRAGAVKLIFLEIIDFKQLETGKVEWKHHTEMDFDVINSQPGMSE